MYCSKGMCAYIYFSSKPKALESGRWIFPYVHVGTAALVQTCQLRLQAQKHHT